MENMTRRELIEQLGQKMGLKDEEEDDKRVEYVAGANALKINKAIVIHNEKEENVNIREKTLEEQLADAITQRSKKHTVK